MKIVSGSCTGREVEHVQRKIGDATGTMEEMDSETKTGEQIRMIETGTC